MQQWQLICVFFVHLAQQYSGLFPHGHTQGPQLLHVASFQPTFFVGLCQSLYILDSVITILVFNLQSKVTKQIQTYKVALNPVPINPDAPTLRLCMVIFNHNHSFNF